ncbi:MAG TPA: hypothetical protein VNE38_19210, partial [Ktedonobacteraceae bacterium]|nr:hypothetical protein [Ktedonobacteraceae bacterium]
APLPVISPLSPIPAMASNLSATPQSFSREDYGAPTTSFQPAKMQTQAALTSAPASRSPRNPGKRSGKRSLLPLVWAIMIVVLLTIGALAYYGYQAVTATAVTVNFGPKVIPLNQVYTLTATTTTQNVDVTTAIIPLKELTNNQSASQSGPTTGSVNCLFFSCQQGVSQRDVNGLAAQIQPGLETTLKKQLVQSVANAGGMQVGPIQYTDSPINSNPAVGQPGNTVIVTLNEQGSVYFFIKADATSVARQAIANQVKQLGTNYSLLSNTVQLGQPTIVSPPSQKVSIKIAAGGDALYQFPASELQAIRNNLKSKTLTGATRYLANQPGIDAQSIAIHFTRGNSKTLPDSIQSITVVPLNANASSYPVIHLQAVPTPAITSTTTDNTPPATPSPTQQGDGNGNGNGNGN